MKGRSLVPLIYMTVVVIWPSLCTPCPHVSPLKDRWVFLYLYLHNKATVSRGSARKHNIQHNHSSIDERSISDSLLNNHETITDITIQLVSIIHPHAIYISIYPWLLIFKLIKYRCSLESSRTKQPDLKLNKAICSPCEQFNIVTLGLTPTLVH